MESLVLASYVFKEDQRSRNRRSPAELPEMATTSARRSVAPLGAAFAGIAAFALVLSFL